MNTKDLITNQEIVNNIADSLEDFPQGSSAKYELWVIGYNLDDKPVSELFIYTFDTPEEALNKAETIDFKFIEEQTEMSITDYYLSNNLERISVEVETTVEDIDELSAGTIYKRELLLNEECEIGLDGDPIIALSSSDFEILDNNVFKIRKELLKDYNKNDYIHVYISDDPDSDILELKITSKVIYEDGDYYHCDFNF